jgi:hypothetical protein
VTSTEVPRHPRATGLLLGGILTGALLTAGTAGLWITLAGPQPLRTESQERTFREPVTGIDISISHGNSSLTLISGPAGVVTVRRQAMWSRAKPVPEEQIVGRTLQISSRCPRVVLPPAGQCQADLVVEVPPGATVRADVEAGRIHAEGLTGAVDLTTYGGDITAAGVRGRLRARSDGGNIIGTELAGTETEVKAEWGDVDLRFTAAPALVRASTRDGDVSISVPRTGTGIDGYQVRADTRNGRQDIDVPQDSAGRHNIIAHTGFGDVSVRHPTPG